MDEQLRRRICRTSGVQASVNTTTTRDAFCRTSTDFVLRACRRSVPSGLHKTFLLLASSWDFVCVCLSYGCKFLRQLAVLRVTPLLLTVLTVKILVNLLPCLLKTLGLRASAQQEMVSEVFAARKRSCFLQARVILESASHTIFLVLMMMVSAYNSVEVRTDCFTIFLLMLDSNPLSFFFCFYITMSS